MKDYLGFPINISDRVIFPAPGEMMEGTVIKLGNRTCSVKNDSGYIKIKMYNVLINISTIKEAHPELEL